MHLVVTEPFGPYARGDRITDPKIVAQVLETHPGHVVRVTVTVPEEKPR